MNKLVEILLLLATGIVTIPILVLFIECAAALRAEASTSQTENAIAPTIGVLVPAHNEARGIAATLERIQAQLAAKDRLLVVADNCEDETAAIARSLGATVIERQDAERRGKGYALDCGIKYLAADPPEVVVIIDADCEVSPGAISRISALSAAKQQPVQANYLMTPPVNPSLGNRVSLFAFKVKNLVRPLGLSQLGLPCNLTGTGMAFPWTIISNAALASGNIVEDMQLGVDLAISGHPTLFDATSLVTGTLPQQQEATATQRTRWEHGHLQTIITQAPRLVLEATKQGRWELLALALELSVPPLSLLVFLWVGVVFLSLLAAIFNGIWLPIACAAGGGLLLFASIIVTRAKFAKEDLPISQLLFVPIYAIGKIPLYLRFLSKSEKNWIRTQRD